MRVGDIVFRSIGFVSEVLGADLTSDSLDHVGTGFFVSVPSERDHVGIRSFCFVTAKHVLHGTPNVDKVVTINRKGGGRKILLTEGNWHEHPDTSVDLAAISVIEDPEADFSAFALEDVFDPAAKGNTIGPGDEVFFTGLFVDVPGHDRNIPIVRFGNLAMLPNQPVYTNTGLAEVYLIEARSIGGISGSPVWVRETVSIKSIRDSGESVSVCGLGHMKLLGVMQTHWDISDINKYDWVHDPKGVNIGIGIVVPARKIIELINVRPLKDLRTQAEDRLIAKMNPWRKDYNGGK